MPFDPLGRHPRVTVRRPGPPDADGRCVVCWMQRAQRALDNPALDLAIDAGNALGKPVVAFFGLVPFPNAVLRHYRFMVEALPDTAARLARRRVGLVIRRHPDADLAAFCAEVRPALVVGDENPLREPERRRQALAGRLRVPFWTVDADVVVPTGLIPNEQFAARTIRPRIGRQLEWCLVPGREPKARVEWTAPRRLHSLRPDDGLLEGFSLDRRVGPVGGFSGGTTEALEALRDFVRHRLGGTPPRATSPNGPAPAGCRPGCTSVTSDRAPWRWPCATRARRPPTGRPSSRSSSSGGNWRSISSATTRATTRSRAPSPGPRGRSASTRATSGRSATPCASSKRRRPTTRCGTPPSARWSRPAGCTATCGCTGARRSSSGVPIRRRRSRRPCGSTTATSSAAAIRTATPASRGRSPANTIAPGGPERPIFGTVRSMSCASTSKKFDSQSYIAQCDEWR